MTKSPSWCVESSVTGTYVATACPYDDDPLREPATRAGKQFARATNTFLQRVEEQPLRLGGLNFTADSAWQAMAAQLVDRYRRAHWGLINSDDEYREAIGET